MTWACEEKFCYGPHAEGTLPHLPLPACGEGGGVRGTLDDLNSWRVPLTRPRFARPTSQSKSDVSDFDKPAVSEIG
jgi:hypothetical protein